MWRVIILFQVLLLRLILQKSHRNSNLLLMKTLMLPVLSLQKTSLGFETFQVILGSSSKKRSSELFSRSSRRRPEFEAETKEVEARSESQGRKQELELRRRQWKVEVEAQISVMEFAEVRRQKELSLKMKKWMSVDVKDTFAVLNPWLSKERSKYLDQFTENQLWLPVGASTERESAVVHQYLKLNLSKHDYDGTKLPGTQITPLKTTYVNQTKRLRYDFMVLGLSGASLSGINTAISKQLSASTEKCSSPTGTLLSVSVPMT